MTGSDLVGDQTARDRARRRRGPCWSTGESDGLIGAPQESREERPVQRMTRKAFTLLEVLLVIMLLGTVMALTWPELGQVRRGEELDESTRRVRTLVQMCRARAMNETRGYRILFRTDGTLKVVRQRDPLYAPHEYYRFREPWANQPFLLEHVWIEAIRPLPDGPPPLLVEDEDFEFEDYADEDPIPVTELERDFEIEFAADGTSTSVVWVMRDDQGRAVELTLDGRLGRVRGAPVARLEAEDVQRPEPLEYDEDEEFEEDLEVLEERQ